MSYIRVRVDAGQRLNNSFRNMHDYDSFCFYDVIVSYKRKKEEVVMLYERSFLWCRYLFIALSQAVVFKCEFTVDWTSILEAKMGRV